MVFEYALPIQQDVAFSRVDDSEQAVEESRFASTCSSDNTNFFSLLDFEVDFLEDDGEVFAVLSWEILELDGAFGEDFFGVPFFFRSPLLAVFSVAFFWLNFGEIKNSLDWNHFGFHVGIAKNAVDNVLVEVHGIGE